MNNQNEICCPEVNPELWEGKTFEWKDKKFIKDKVRTLFYIPINFGTVMTRSIKKIDNAGARTIDGMVLSESTSWWNMDVYLAVDKQVSGAENVTLNGKFLCKVYEGEYKEMEKWIKNFEVYIKSRNLVMKKMYMWYTTCPKCAKKYGKNYVVFVGEI